MPVRVFQRPLVLAPVALLFLFAECAVYHFPLTIGVHTILLIVALGWPLLIAARHFTSLSLSESVQTALTLFIAVVFYFAIYNLNQFHFTTDGGILTRGLFGVDIPFLAGEVHGLRNFGELRDLHQSAQPWHYHDAIYRLLALFGPETTLADVGFAAPLAGYTLLAFAVFILVHRVTMSGSTAWFAVLAWFVCGGWAGLDASSCALSPSFVFGSVVFVSILLVQDVARDRAGVVRVALNALALLLMIALAETKITSFLVLTAGLLMMAAVSAIRRRWTRSIEYVAISILPLALVALTSKADPLMPAGDFLVGAPLMGYANHVAAILHVSVASVNPVTHASLSVKSLLLLPYFVFHFLRFVVLDPRLIAVLILIFFVRPKTELGVLLALIVPLGFFLPVLYSPAWYPLALSFYAPLVGIQSAILLTAIEWQELAERRVPRIAFACLFGFSLAAGLSQIVKADSSQSRTESAGFVQAMDSISAKVPQRAIIVSRRHDLETNDESYYWYSALSARSVVSAGAKYGSLLASMADTDPQKGLHRVPAAENLLRSRRSLIDMVYSSHDSGQVLFAMEALHGSYVLIDQENLDSVVSSDLFDSVFHNGTVTLLKIRPYLMDNSKDRNKKGLW